MNSIILIPAYKPENRMTDLVASLAERGFEIVVVDDGSGSGCREIFACAKRYAHVITCENNRGKGAALKTGLAYIERHFQPPYTVTTADADGQHCLEDIVRVSAEASDYPDAAVIGCRKMSRKMPTRNFFGNVYTKAAFFLASGKFLGDTQTGLRSFSDRQISFLLKVKGNRYEYEINVLLWWAYCGCTVIEIPISTIYHDGNSGSHFHAIFDSARVYREIIRFSAPRFLAFLLDILLFAVLFAAGLPFIAANAAARLVSAALHFTLLRAAVSRVMPERIAPAARYAAFAAVSLALNTLILYLLTLAGINVVWAKALANVALYFMTFAFQQKLLFTKAEEDNQCS